MDGKRAIGFAVLAVAVIGSAWLLNERRTATQTADSVPAAELPGAVMLDGLDGFDYPVTANAEAQRWFNQGMILTFGFNHDAAERSFLRAAEADPSCAMCWWGAALVLGPHVNAGMDPANAGTAWTRAQKALALSESVTPRERAYIEALAHRYAEQAPADRRALDQAWADAIGEVARQHPDDSDAATLYAEALMDLQPWDYYDADGTPKGNTETIVATLEGILQRTPDHPGALHLYIHAVEASNSPDRGAIAADRLRELVPGAGHLVHMPAHIYTRVGRYRDAMTANQKAIAADNAYLAACRPGPGVYPLGYVPHNHHFLWFAASMAGDAATALAAADATRERAEVPELIKAPGYAALQHYSLTPLFAKVRFGRWDEIAALPQPDAEMPYVVAMWHYAQALAAIRQKRIQDATEHARRLTVAAADPTMEELMVWDRYSLALGLRVAERIVAGELAAAQQRYDDAIAALETAVALDDALPYDEPPAWHSPARHTLGAVLLSAGRAAAAESAYREDLRRNPGNGWALAGLNASLRAQKRLAEAEQVRAQFEQAWANPETPIESSRM